VKNCWKFPEAEKTQKVVNRKTKGKKGSTIEDLWGGTVFCNQRQRGEICFLKGALEERKKKTEGRGKKKI